MKFQAFEDRKLPIRIGTEPARSPCGRACSAHVVSISGSYARSVRYKLCRTDSEPALCQSCMQGGLCRRWECLWVWERRYRREGPSESLTFTLGRRSAIKSARGAESGHTALESSQFARGGATARWSNGSKKLSA